MATRTGRAITPWAPMRAADVDEVLAIEFAAGEPMADWAVDDELGLMAVLNTVSDVKRFVRHLTRSATRASSFMTLEDISDTLTGDGYHPTNTGSSGKTPMLKFFARTGGMRIEFIIHTSRSYLNYIYQRDVAHDEYEVKRIFDTGVAAFLFPPDIYRLDLEKIRSHQLTWVRRRIEEH